jgi:diguanylate cyclase (GGDEF)-like protein
MHSVNLLVTDKSPESAEHINSLLRNSGIKIHVIHTQSCVEVKRALDRDAPVLILYGNPDESDAPLEEVSALAAASNVPVALYTPLNDTDRLTRLLDGTACFVINAEREDLLTESVIRLVRTSESAREHASRKSFLEELEHRYDLLLHSSRDAVAYIHEGLHVQANRAYLEALKVEDEAEIAGLSLLEVLKAEGVNLKTLFKGFSKGKFPDDPLDVEVLRPDGSTFEASLVFSPARFDGEDCTQMMMQNKDGAHDLAIELERMRIIDPLTQFQNRQAFAQALNDRIAQGHGDLASAVLYVEPDGYEKLQDELDVSSLDTFIADLASITKLCLKDGDVPARLNDKGFAILVHRQDTTGLEALADEILTVWRGHIVEMDDRALSVSCSIGMAPVGRLTTDATEIIAQARNAQGEAAEAGDQLVIYRPRLTAVSTDGGDDNWAERIKFALSNQDFYTVQQSIVDLEGEGDQLIENMTFLRCEDGDRPPRDYLPPAEQGDLAGTIDRHVIPGLLKTFVDSEERQVVNISSNSVLDYSFPGWFADQLKAACIDGKRVVLQIAAEAAQSNLKPAQRLLKELRPLGCHLSISGFDDQRRSLQLLDHLDVSFVKLKSELTQDLTGNSKNQELIQKIVEAADPNDVAVIADEVEDTSSLAVLWQCGVKLIAGAFVKESSQVLAQ